MILSQTTQLVIQVLQSTPDQWTPAAVIQVLGVLLTAALAIIGAWKGLRNEGQTAALSQRVDAQSQTQRVMRSDLTQVALAATPPAAPAAPPPASGPPVAANLPTNLAGGNPPGPYP